MNSPQRQTCLQKKCFSQEIEKYANPAESALYFLKTKSHLSLISANSGFQKWGG